MPRILRATDPAPASWPTALGRAATLGFDTLLLPALPAGEELPPKLTEAAAGLKIRLLLDVVVDHVPAALAAGGPFTTLLAPTLDPRQEPRQADHAQAAVATADDARALASWWGKRLAGIAGLAGVRLIGLGRLPGWSVGPFCAALREACPGLLLFGWTPGLAWPVLAAIPAGALDLVACSLPWWDGRADWIWRELDTLRRIAPVVADSGDDPARIGLAASLAEGWMTTADMPGVETLNKTRAASLAELPWTRPVSPPGGGAVVLLRTDVQDPRYASRAALAVTGIGPHAAVPAHLVLAAVEGPLGPFKHEGGTALHPANTLSPEPGTLSLYTASVRPAPQAPPLSRKRAEAAGGQPRIAIEAPSPCVENGRFSARLVAGSLVAVEADIIVDGHEHLAAVVKYRAPGEDAWTEVPMTLINNDRWTASFPLDRLGTYHYVIEAWKDVFGTYKDELSKKWRAGIPIGLELQEGTALVKAADARQQRGSKGLLRDIVKAISRASADKVRDTLLSDATEAAMRKADDRPFRIATAELPVQAERPGAAFASWYEVFPRSMSGDESRHGTFRDVANQLPRVQAMGFDVLYFPPIHPIGRKNRKGRNNTLTPSETDPGSPYAIGSEAGGHEALHPELGTLEDFQFLRQRAAEHGIELAIDFAIQCSPDHPWLREHKDWFMWRPDGTIRYAENPPKKYEDIVNVDFYASGAIPDLWLALANAVMYWASQGVRLFRVDNPHTKPLPFWEWMIGEVQARYPDSVFLAEAFTRPKVMYRLAKVGFSQSYTYFTWRNTKREFQEYLTELSEGPPRDFFRPHFFVNTPDINPIPLQGAPRSAFLTRAALATTLSGLWGVYSGFELCEATPVPGKEEYLDSEKYQLRAWDWDRPGNIVAEIAALNAIRKRNPALHTHLGVTFLNADNEQVLLFEKATPDRSNVLLVAINMDLRDAQSSRISVPFWRWTPEPGALEAIDLVRDRVERWTDRNPVITLTPDQPYAIWRLTPAESFA